MLPHNIHVAFYQFHGPPNREIVVKNIYSSVQTTIKSRGGNQGPVSRIN